MLEAVHIDARATRDQVRTFLGDLGLLARRHRDMELALAQLLAWLKGRDPAELGYTSFAAFTRERVGWRTSWLRDMVRLAESPLDLVKQAVRDGVVPLRIAVRALGRIDADGQRDWLARAVFDEVPSERRVLEEVDGDDATVIRNARRLARVCIGRVASDREVDDYILGCWRDRLPPDVILARAHERPLPPPPAPPLSWAWLDEAEPTSVADALARMDRLQDVLRGRRIVLARAWAGVVDDRLWSDDFEDSETCACEVLGISGRQAQRLARLGRTLDLWPEIEQAVRNGLAIGGAERIGEVVGEHDVGGWLAIAERVGRLELERAVADARERGESRTTIGTYAEAVAAADRSEATSAGGPVRVAIPHPEAERPARPVRAPRGLVAAARWFCETVRIPTQRGFGEVKVRDAFRCQNPECGRLSLRNEAHHLVFRSAGGSDTPDNGVTLCRCCHLRGVHAGRLEVGRVEVGGRAALLWRWPDGRRTLAFRA